MRLAQENKLFCKDAVKIKEMAKRMQTKSKLRKKTEWRKKKLKVSQM